VFDDLGVSDAIRAGGMAPPPFRVYLDGEFATMRTMLDAPEPTSDLPYPSVWMVPQWRTEEILRARLAELGTTVEFGTPLTGFTPTEHGVTVELGAETVEARYLVGADGGRSTVRKQLGIGFVGETDEALRLVLGDVAAPALDHAVGHWFARLGLSTTMMRKYTGGAEDAGDRGRDTQQLDLNYRDSVLSVTNADVLADLHAGDRVPDAQLGDGRRLFDVLRGPHATMLGFGVPVGGLAGERVEAVQIDGRCGDVATNLGAKPGAVLVVRPDGYLGYVGDAAASARTYLERITCPARR
jgi:hypothetical protein